MELESENRAPQTISRHHSNIQNILQQVRTGQRNKSEAFSELRNILTSSLRKTEDSPNSENYLQNNVQVEESDNRSTGSGAGAAKIASRLSLEERRQLINRLIEKKKGVTGDAVSNGDRRPQSANSGSFIPSDGSFNADGYPIDPYGGYGGREVVGDATGISSIVADDPTHHHEDDDYYEEQENEQEQEYRGPHAHRRSSTGSVGSGSNNQYRGDARTNRIAQSEAAIRMESFKECTFRPKVKELPDFYGGARTERDRSTPFYDRVMRWKEEKHNEAIRREHSVNQSSMVECSFHPRISRNSERAAREMRSGAEFDTNERLFRDSEYSILKRNKFIEDELDRNREMEAQVCTFQPHLKTQQELFQKVQPRFDKPKKPAADDTMIEERMTRECTFQPKVKGVKSHMTSAKLYCSTNIVDRLTKPLASLVPSPGADSMQAFDDPYRTVDASAFIDANNGSSYYATPGYGLGGERGGERGRGRSNSVGSGTTRRASSAPAGDRSVSVSIDMETFQKFYGRQQQSVRRKEKNVEKITSVITPHFKPELCKKSLLMSERHFRGEFLDRVERDVLRRTDTTEKQKKQIKAGVVHSFQPEILKKSQKLRSRSVYEMSRGDLLRKETNHRMTKLRLEEEQLLAMTFRPALTPKASVVKSALKVTEDPDRIIQWYGEKLEKQEIQRQRIFEERAQEELKDCTFIPQTKDCPSYVKRIAKSMQVVKAARAGNRGQPEWR